MKHQRIICDRVERKNIDSAGDFIVLVTDSATLVQNISKSDAGLAATQQLDIIADITVDMSIDLQQIPQLFKLTTNEGVIITWGDTTYKSRCISCERTGEASRISFVRTSPNLEL